MIKVSVVIPIYNGEKYLKECLDSVCRQTLSDIEVICIDDGSIDNSAKIIHNIQLHDSRVKYFKQNNLGVSDARNSGLFKCKAKYVQFVDQDDVLESNMLDSMYSTAVANDLDVISSDISFFGVDQNIDFHMPIIKNKVLNFTLHSIQIQSYLESFFTSSKGQGAIWNKLYRKDLLMNSHKFISRKVVKSEDTVFSFLILLGASRVMFVDDIFYKYRVCSSSQSRANSNQEVDLTINMINYIAVNIEPSKSWLRDILKDVYTKNIAFNMVQTNLVSRDISVSDKLMNLKRIFGSSLFDSQNLKKASLKKKVIYYTYRCGFARVFCILARFYRNNQVTHLELVKPYV